MEKAELAAALIEQGAILELGCRELPRQFRPKKLPEKLKNDRSLEDFYELCSRDKTDPREILYLALRPGARAPCECGAPTKFWSLERGYGSSCARCMRKRAVSKGAASKHLARSKTGKYPGVEKRIENRRSKYGPSLMGEEARKRVSARMSKLRARLKDYIGVDNPSQLPSVQEKTRQSALAKYGVLHQQKHLTPEAVTKLGDRSYLASKSSIDIQRDTGASQSHISKILASHGLSPERSSLERSFHDWLDHLKIDYQKNLRRKFEMREMDVVVDASKLCIELNGLYWHSRTDGTALSPLERRQQRAYHLDKTEAARRAGYSLFHVWEDDWRDRREIVQSMVGSRLKLSKKVMARALAKSALEPNAANLFFERNHLQGANKRIKEAYGLFDADGELTACIGIGKSRFGSGEELIRFASLSGLSIAGGFTKLLSMVKGRRLRTYCRLDTSTGDGYLASGWKKIGQTKPGYWYTDNINRFNRMRFQKHVIAGGGDPRPEWQIMQEDRKMHRVWDCGQLVFELNAPPGD